MKLHHVGIAVGALKEAIPVFEKLLGAPPISEEIIEEQKVRVAIFAAGESRIELLEATSEESPIARFLARRGQGVHHLTIAVSNLPETLARLDRQGMRLVDRAPRRGAGNERIAFLHPSSTAGVLIELVEEKP